MKFLIPFCLFLFVGSYAQDTIVVDSSFGSVSLCGNAHYFFDASNEQSVASILTADFQPYNTTNHGVKDAKFWFRFELENPLNESKELFIRLKANTVSSLSFYQKRGDVLEKQFVYENSLKRDIDIPFVLPSNVKTEYYIEVLFNRSTYFPAKIVTEEQNQSISTWILIVNSLFSGFSFVVLVINLLFFFNTKNKFFLYYSFLLVAIYLSVIDTQGKLSALINNPQLKYFIVFVLNIMLIVTHIVFTANALNLRKYFPKYKVIGISLLSGLVVSYLLFFITSNILWYRFAKGFYFISIILFWFYGVLLFRKFIYARLYTIAYFSLLCFEIFYMLSMNFGAFGNFYTEQLLQLGCFIEMLVFLYAISYRHKEVEKKKGNLELSYSESLENIKKLEAQVLLQKQKARDAFEEQINFFRTTYDLNDREVEVLQGHLKGLKNKEIANEIFLSEASVKHYNGRIFSKTNTKNKIQLINLFNALKA